MSLIRNVGILSAGQGIAQLISLVGYIGLARLYTPDDFGVIALVLAVSTLLSGVSSFRYEMTILLPKSGHLAELAANLSILLSIVVHLVFMTGAILIAILVGFWSVESCFFVISISFFNSVLNISAFIQNREKRYIKTITISIIRNTCFLVFAMAIWYVDVRQNGLVLSYFISTAVLSVYLFLSEFNLKTLRSSYRANYRTKAWLNKYSDFFKFSTPAVFCNLAAQNVPILLISVCFGEAAVGTYSMVQRVIMAPVSLLSGAVNRVYIQQISELRYKKFPIFNFTKMLIRNISIPVFIICFFSLCLLSAGFLEFSFGDQWKGIDYLAIILIPVMGISFLSKAIAGFAVLGRNSLGLIFQLVLLVVVASSIGMVYFLGGGEVAVYGALSFSLSTVYLAQIFTILGISKSMDKGFI